MLDDYGRVIEQHWDMVAEQDGNVVGVLVLIQTDSKMLLDNLAVHPQHQGRGLGRRLIEPAQSETQARGYTHLDLYTHGYTTENIGIYEARGYVETERKNVRGYDRVYMRKTFSQDRDTNSGWAFTVFVRGRDRIRLCFPMPN